MGTLEGKVAFITGVARGQGRSHALRLAGEGADIIGIDICRDIASIDYPNASAADLAETAEQVGKLGRRILTSEADVRDAVAVRRAIDDGVAEFSRLDIVLSNAGIVRLGPDADDPAQVWRDIVETNMSGGFHVVNAAIPHLIAGGRGGVIVLTGSTAGVRPVANPGVGALAYTASKWGLAGMCRQLAATLAEHSIRVNIVHPTGVASGMTMNAAMAAIVARATADDASGIAAMQNAMPVQILQPDDISDAIAFLVSDQAKWITGVSLPVDAGFSIR
jgi:SDR family mycofactocin-dependent oxidoreductase